MNPKTHLRLFCVLLAACLLLPLAAACRQGGEGTGTQTGAHTDSPGTESGTSGSGETTGKPDDPIAPNDTGFSVSRLRVDSQTLPLGLDNAAPLFSWNMTVGQEDTVRGRVQTAYRVLVASDRGLLESGTADMWDSGTVQDGASVNIRYGGAPLLPMTRYFWTVQVTDGNGGMQCAPVAWFETGVGEDGFADASWIGAAASACNLGEACWIWQTGGAADGRIPEGTQLFRRAFRLAEGKTVANAILLFTADDCGTVYLNGRQVGEIPRRTDAWKNGQAVDVTDRLTAGENLLAASVTNTGVGYAGFVAHLLLTYSDGSQESVLTNAQGWRVSRDRIADFASPDCDDSGAGWGAPDQSVRYGSGAWASLVTFSGGAALQDGNAAPMLRREFSLPDKEITSARVYATAAGIYDLHLNGQRVGDAYLTPSWTEYDSHILYQTYDVTSLVRAGANALGVQLGNGWYCGRIGSYGGTAPAFIGKLVVTFADGSTVCVVSDSNWSAYTNGPVLENDLFDGETYDARRLPAGWSDAGFDGAGWTPVRVTSARALGIGKIIAQFAGNIKVMDSVQAVSVSQIADKTYIYDFGQNLSGVVSLTLTGEAGQTVKLRFAEMLNDGSGTGDGREGTLYTQNLRSAKNTDVYILRGDAEGETWYPTLTYRGFRYVEISGIAEPLPTGAVTARVLYTEMEDTGSFDCSAVLINQLWSNTYWGQRGNFLSVPTDCPQRDERMGWSGDAQIFCGTAAYNMDVRQFFAQYVMVLNDCQLDNGAYTDVAPGNQRAAYTGAGHNAWADAGIIIPYTMGIRYGDTGLAETYWQNMDKYIRYLVRDAGRNGIRNTQAMYGDWLSIGESTPLAVCDTAWCVYVCDLMAEMAGWFGKDADAVRYAGYAESFRSAWCAAFLREDGTTVCGTQTSYALALAFGIIPEDLRAASAAQLAMNIADHGWKLTTGFMGVSFLLPVLTEYGYTDVAYKLLEQEAYPSWIYPILQGATTIWERWNSYTVESGFGDAGMNSFNHYSYGSVMEWVYSTLLGISDDGTTSAYRHFVLKPTPGGSLTYASGSFASPYGTVQSGWRLENGNLVYTCTVPANTTATLYLPGARGATVLESGRALDGAPGVTVRGYENGRHILELVSGTYTFMLPVQDATGAACRLRISNPDGIRATVLLDGKPLQSGANLIPSGTHTLSVVCEDEAYAFAYAGGDVFFASAEATLQLSGDTDIALHFGSRGTGSGTSALTVSAPGCTQAFVNGQAVSLPYTVRGGAGETVTVELLPPAGYRFAGWDDGTTTYPAVFTLGGADRTVTARLERLPMLDSLLAGIVATGNDTALSTSDWNLGNLTDGVTVGTGYSTAENYTSPTLKRPVYLDFALPGPVYADRVVLWPRTDAESMSGGSHAFPQDFTVSVRPEGTADYVTVAAYTDLQDRSQPFTVGFAGRTVTHIRITVTKTAARLTPQDSIYRVQFAEIQAFDTRSGACVTPLSGIAVQSIGTAEAPAFAASVMPADAYSTAVTWLVLDADGKPAADVTATMRDGILYLRGARAGTTYVILAVAADGSGARGSLNWTA